MREASHSFSSKVLPPRPKLRVQLTLAGAPIELDMTTTISVTLLCARCSCTLHMLCVTLNTMWRWQYRVVASPCRKCHACGTSNLGRGTPLSCAVRYDARSHFMWVTGAQPFWSCAQVWLYAVRTMEKAHLVSYNDLVERSLDLFDLIHIM